MKKMKQLNCLVAQNVNYSSQCGKSSLSCCLFMFSLHLYIAHPEYIWVTFLEPQTFYSPWNHVLFSLTKILQGDAAIGEGVTRYVLSTVMNHLQTGFMLDEAKGKRMKIFF